MTLKFSDLKALVARLTPEEKAELDKQMAPELEGIFLPNPGAQTLALRSKADLLLYGGAAGGGKSALLVGAATEHHRAKIFRRESQQLDGVRDFATELYGDRAKYNGQDDEFTFSTQDCKVKLGGMKEPGDWKKYAGRASDYLGFDEAGEFAEEQISSMLAWNRGEIGQRLRVIFASNPPRGSEGQWLREWFSPWLNPLDPKPAVPGELRWAIMVAGKTVWVDGPEPVTVEGEEYLPMSRTFVPALLADNPFNDSTAYRARLSGLPEPLRSQLLYGDFLAEKSDHEFQVIPSEWIALAQARWKPERPKVKMLALGVDIAQGGPDQTCLAPLNGSYFDRLVTRAGVDTKDGPAVAGLVIATMRDNCQISLDLTGGWGISARDHLAAQGIRVISVVFSAASGEMAADGRLGFYNTRAQIYWKLREALDPNSGENVALPPDQRLAAELAAPTWTIRGDKILIESKQDLRKRLGVSPDRADAVCLAWHDRASAVFMQTHGSKLATDWAYTQQNDPFDDF